MRSHNAIKLLIVRLMLQSGAHPQTQLSFSFAQTKPIDVIQASLTKPERLVNNPATAQSLQSSHV